MTAPFRRAVLALPVAALALAALPLIGFTAPASAQDAVRIGYTPRGPQAPIYVAAKKGFYEEEGLKVELSPVQGATPTILPQLARGDLDVLFGGPAAAVFNAMSEGLRFRIVADGGRIDPDFDGFPYLIVVRKDLYDAGEFKTLADLKGKRVAFGVRGTSLAYMMLRALDKAGLEQSDLEIRWDYRTTQDMGVALGNKSLDASAMIVPVNTGLTEQGIAVDWLDAREIAPDMQSYMIILSEDFVENRRDEAVKFLRAYKKAVDWISEQIAGDPKELIEIVAAETKQTPEQILAGSWTYYDPELRINEEDLVRQYDTWVEEGLAKPGLKLLDFVDNPLREEAVSAP